MFYYPWFLHPMYCKNRQWGLLMEMRVGPCCKMSFHFFSLCVSLDMSERWIPEIPISQFFIPPQFYCLCPSFFWSLPHHPLILCPFIKTTKKEKKWKKIQRKLLVVWLQIPQCHQVFHNIMTTFETAYCLILILYAHTAQEWWWICGVGEGRLTVKGALSETVQQTRVMKDTEVGARLDRWEMKNDCDKRKIKKHDKDILRQFSIILFRSVFFFCEGVCGEMQPWLCLEKAAA